MKFYKMQGAGNDYIFFDCMKKSLENPSGLAVRLSDRHFSVGGDGIILMRPSRVADVKMEMYNADGSEGKMCGNGIRCLAKLARDLGYVSKNNCTVETLSGVRSLELFFGSNGKVNAACVDMGVPVLDGEKIPSLIKGDRITGYPLEAGGKEFPVTLVSVGNPHCVIFTDNPSEAAVYGPLIENHPAFPERINAEFVAVRGRELLEVRVWERGSGETLACGTGACAAAVAAVMNGYCREGERITVRLAGGDLSVTCTRGGVYLYGMARLCFTGEIKL